MGAYWRNPKVAKLPKWKPTMYRSDADKWAKGSSLDEVYFHRTTDVSAKKIKKEGFKIGDPRFGRAYGDGIYMTDERYAMQYGEELLQVRVRTKKTFMDPDGTLLNTNSEISKEMDVWMKKHNINIYDADAPNVVSEFLKERGYDSVLTMEDDIAVFVIFDPKNTTVIK